MPRQKLSEYRAKYMLAKALGQAYKAWQVDAAEPIAAQLQDLPDGRYVVKVDQAVKRRMKQGLVKLDRSPAEIAKDIAGMSKHGYRFFLVEPFQSHEATQESYIALAFSRAGTQLSYAAQGGIEIETRPELVQTVLADAAGMATTAQALGVDDVFITKLVACFEASAASFLEINPLLVDGQQVTPLDVAVEVDDATAFRTAKYWTPADYRVAYQDRQPSPQEMVVARLADRSRASLRLELMNPDGAIWLLLSGGGASVVLADECYNQGYGAQLGNYGEYSGNPSSEETYGYATQLIAAMLASKAKQKVLLIAGAAANFTDVRATFAGLIRALDEAAPQLQQQNVKVYVRRGGPHQAAGLRAMCDCLQRHGILGAVHGPEQGLADSVAAALASLPQEVSV